uniref:folate gamma-glutamyl hydrolase n=1 Tax=Rousettus aegyptiacus TaxID=9407 RepID=A0A7J8C1S7_ROUAE|nr:gamma-glutamyl hydrolase [Rousettus aegyptiacus]
MASLGRLLCLLVLLCGAANLALSAHNAAKLRKPIIGVLMQKCRNKMKSLGKYYIAASYVKYLESAGARVVPVRLDLTKKEYRKLFQSLNGVLFPGGSVNLKSSGYAHVAKIFYNLARQDTSIQYMASSGIQRKLLMSGGNFQAFPMHLTL